MKKANILQEADLSYSMRRSLALLYALCSVACFILASMTGSLAGAWSGGLCLVGVLVLTGYTTIEGLKGLAGAIKGTECGKEN